MRIMCAGVLSLLCGIAVYAQNERSQRLVQGWGAFMQSVEAVSEYVATSELSSIHNEDMAIAEAISVLRAESALPPAQQGDALRTLTAFGQQLSDVHEAADAFNAAETKIRFKKLLTTYATLKAFYTPEILSAASRLAAAHVCPMHRDVRGKRSDTCPKCGMQLDQPLKVQLSALGVPPQQTVRARIRTEAPPERGKELKATLRLDRVGGGPILTTDLRVVHTQRIHLLIVDPTLTDYHHVHPQPTSVPGQYAFTFVPSKAGPYRAWADLRTTYAGFQEYATADIPGSAKVEGGVDRREKLDGQSDELRFTLVAEKRVIAAGEPTRATLHVTDSKGRPFRRLEPIMAAFAHLVAFHEDWKTVLHLHPKNTQLLLDTSRGGPTLDFQFYATQPGYYRLFAQVQIKGESRFVPFGLTVASAGPTTTAR